MVRANLNKEDMVKLWSTKDILGQDEREILICHHMLNHGTFKTLIRLSNRDIIP